MITAAEEILDELFASEVEVLVLLGDKPIEWFLKYYLDQWKRLSDFGEYSRLHKVNIGGKELDLLPMAHPRQIARLGRSSKKWYDRHQEWLGGAGELLS